jgi:hypothetical protein
VQTSYHICRVQCALPVQPVTARKILSFLRPAPFPAEKILYSTFVLHTTLQPVVSTTLPRPFRYWITRRKARDMATGYGDQSSSSQLFPLFGKLRFSQKTKDKFQKASQGPIGHSVACLETVVAALCRGRDCCRECAESYQCTSCTCEFTIPEPPLTTTFTWIFKSPLG